MNVGLWKEVRIGAFRGIREDKRAAPSLTVPGRDRDKQWAPQGWYRLLGKWAVFGLSPA